MAEPAPALGPSADARLRGGETAHLYVLGADSDVSEAGLALRVQRRQRDGDALVKAPRGSARLLLRRRVRLFDALAADVRHLRADCARVALGGRLLRWIEWLGSDGLGRHHGCTCLEWAPCGLQREGEWWWSGSEEARSLRQSRDADRLRALGFGLGLGMTRRAAKLTTWLSDGWMCRL